MDKMISWFSQPQNLMKASKLSRRIAIVLGVLTILAVILLIVVLRPVADRIPLIHLLDEMDDEIGSVAMLLIGSVVFAWLSRFLRRRGNTFLQADKNCGDTVISSPVQNN